MTFNDLRDAAVVADHIADAGMAGAANELRSEIILAAKALLAATTVGA